MLKNDLPRSDGGIGSRGRFRENRVKINDHFSSKLVTSALLRQAALPKQAGTENNAECSSAHAILGLTPSNTSQETRNITHEALIRLGHHSESLADFRD